MHSGKNNYLGLKIALQRLSETHSLIIMRFNYPNLFLIPIPIEWLGRTLQLKTAFDCDA
ncbi:hypothetical protein Cylst_4604 [Cylindrospermum stagnale PCC 7417]|uniref:Uncharacterized protein n=1 Tax=Cylindrospermum stagnale PCC 7417 TaxID=56107 RepID=K9X214_9NOST|nr:hypothetical protein Cylst_4604 [Cylindrospermum stagnale PCC 7417]